MERGPVVWHESEEFVGVYNTKTGDVWWATEDLKEKLLEHFREQDEMYDRECDLD